jgi:hypothetical protein
MLVDPKTILRSKLNKLRKCVRILRTANQLMRWVYGLDCSILHTVYWPPLDMGLAGKPAPSPSTGDVLQARLRCSRRVELRRGCRKRGREDAVSVGTGIQGMK